MRLLFLVSDDCWSARARVFVMAARGLAARGHETVVACESDCPVQVRAAADGVEVVSLDAHGSGAGDMWQLRRTLGERPTDVLFVHTDSEHMIASSAARLGAGGASVIRRVPPFAVTSRTPAARIASRVTPTGCLYSTEADRERAGGHGRVPGGVAPLAVDAAEHDAIRPHERQELGAPAKSRLVACVHDGSDRAAGLAALRTLALLSPRHPDLHLVVVGPGTSDELRMHAAALGVSAMVSILGQRDDELSILRTADVGWIAADGDTAALAALDFMAFRIPVVAERSPVTEHFIADGVTGALLSRGDAATTAAAVAAFLAGAPRHAAMGAAGRARLERDFPFDAMLNGFETMARSVSGRSVQNVG